MSELIPPSSAWKFRLSLDESTLDSQLGKQRLLSIKTFLDGNARLYSAVSVKDGQASSWDGKIKPSDLKTTLGTKLRLTALDCFEEKRKTYCAAAWVENPKSIKWNWRIDFTPASLNAKLEKENGKLISIRACKTTLGGKLGSAEIRYCAIWVEDDGVEWDWIPNAVADSIDDTLDAKAARLVSIDNLDNTTWLGDTSDQLAGVPRRPRAGGGSKTNQWKALGHGCSADHQWNWSEHGRYECFSESKGSEQGYRAQSLFYDQDVDRSGCPRQSGRSGA